MASSRKTTAGAKRRPAPPASKSTVKKRAAKAAGQSAAKGAYHHGALREALIEASEALLAERGTEGFSLREVARRSGVSPAAPAHHFGDVAGLLTAVATLAFDGLTAELRAGVERGGDDPAARLREQGIGYVDFALRYPGRFGLMFRCLPDEAGEARRDDEALSRSARAGFTVLEDGVRLLLGVPPDAPLAPVHWQAILSTWSLVHGFAHLALSGQFEQVLQGMAAARGAELVSEGRTSGPGRIDRATLLRELLSPMLDQQARGLLVPVPGAATSGPR